MKYLKYITERLYFLKNKHIKGIFYHGTTTMDSEIYTNTDFSYSDWESYWLSSDESISKKFSYNISNNDEYQVVYRINLNVSKLCIISIDDARRLQYMYNIEDLRDAIPYLKEHGYNGWITIGSIGIKTYDDICIFYDEYINLKECSVCINGVWSEYLPIEEAQKLISENNI